MQGEKMITPKPQINISISLRTDEEFNLYKDVIEQFGNKRIFLIGMTACKELISI